MAAGQAYGLSVDANLVPITNNSTVQSVQSFSGKYKHPLIAGGATLSLQGFFLEEEFFTTDQQIENSKIKLLVGGGGIGITNAVRSGTVTLKSFPTGLENKLDSTSIYGNIVALAMLQRDSNDSTGSEITIQINQGTAIYEYVFFQCMVNKVPTLKVAGNDVPTYETSFRFTDFSITTSVG